MSAEARVSRRRSLVVVAYRRPDQLARLLRSVDLDVAIVVVNVAADPDVGRTAALAAANVVVVDMDNRGFGAAMNVGVRHAPDGSVVVSNDDVEFRPHALADLFEWVEGHGGLAAPAVQDASGRLQATIAANVSIPRLLWEWAVLPDRRPPGLPRSWAWKWRRPTSAEAVPGVAAAVIACSTDLLARLPMPEHYFLYWEEREWFTRLEWCGERVVYLPSSQVVHSGGARDVRPEKNALLAGNALICVRSLFGWRRALAAIPVVVLWQMRLLLQTAVLVGARRRPSEELRSRVAGVAAAAKASGRLLRGAL